MMYHTSTYARPVTTGRTLAMWRSHTRASCSSRNSQPWTWLL